MDKRAYYLQWPNLEMSAMLKFDGASPSEPNITHTDHLAPEVFIACLMTDGYETFAYSWEPAERKWIPIDVASLPDVTLVELDTPYAQRRQLRKGQVVTAPEKRVKGQSQWHVEGAPPLPPHSVEPVAMPREFEEARESSGS